MSSDVKSLAFLTSETTGNLIRLLCANSIAMEALKPSMDNDVDSIMLFISFV